VTPDPIAMIEREVRAEHATKNGHAAIRAGAQFSSVGEDRYRFELPAIGVVFDIDRLRRDKSELSGELAVSCQLPGARTVNGILSIADFNLSSLRARQDRAKALAQRANVQGVDWYGLVEEFCQRVLSADRKGQPAVDLRTVAAPADTLAIEVEGFQVWRKHPTVIFGDGGTAKSYLGLYYAGMLAERGISVALFDWELGAEDHRVRLERMFPDGMPRVLYARCERALVHETDRLRRIVRENAIEFAIFDFGCIRVRWPP